VVRNYFLPGNANSLKVYRSLLVATFLLSFYSWSYHGFLYEALYLKYIPNYTAEQTFPTYDRFGNISNLDESPVSDSIESYLPWYCNLFRKIAIGSMALNPFLYLFTLLDGIFILFIERYFSFKLFLFQLVVFIPSAIFIMNTNIMD